jgi:hypothetical protein
MLNSNSEALTFNEVKVLVDEWQKCRMKNLPDLFMGLYKVRDEAGNETEETQAERLVTFRLDNADVKKIVELTEDMEEGTNPRFLIHLGLKDGYLSDVKIGSPRFTLILQIRNDGSGLYDNCFELKWEPNPAFPTNAYESSLSGKDAIPGASAFLFVHRWLETPFHNLAKVFEATAYNLCQRIKAYRYPTQDTQPILDAIKEQDAGGTGLICIHLGSGITVSSHPYAFRPILEITKVSDSKVDAAASGGGKFYDFSTPVPPY